MSGLFYRDMRHLSRWQIRLNGRELDVLSADTLDYDEAVFFLIEPTGTIYRNPTLSLVRHRHVGDGMQEQLEMTNHGTRPVQMELSLLFGADFADIFEIKDKLAKVGEFARRVDNDRVTLMYRNADFYRETCIRAPGAFFTAETVQGASLPAAGLPWFMALFGRDSLIASYQALPFVPELCRTTLRALAHQQATEFDDFRDAEPGKILHELRHGELTHFGQRPQSPYYGSCDSTPLFLIVLDEYERWTGDVATVRELEQPARAALRWIEEYGDTNHDGYLDYQTRNPESGLANQCWKDSWNSIVWPDGRLTSLPRATCEIQGYAYDARIRTARLAREIWGDGLLADRLERDAAALQERFLSDFWLPEQGFYALALDGEKQAIPTLTSNIGHLLWSGIVPEEHVDQVVGQLLGPWLFSGWGVRTLAAGQGAYNPLEYHNGTVWPHDTALIAAGLARYGRRVEANRLAMAILEAARHFDYRLPEVFVGYDRKSTGLPVPYGTACSPHAWAAGTPLLLLRVILGLEPDRDRLAVDPGIPEGIGNLAPRGIPGRWGRTDAKSWAD